jgi:hypothetical protein
MKRFAIILLALGTSLTLTLSGCGGGGGDGGAAPEANPTFTQTAALAQVDPVTPATFSTAVAINDDAATATDDAVGASQPAGVGTTLQAVAWTVTPGAGTTAPTSTVTPLTVPVGTTYSRANGINNGTVADPADIVGEMDAAGAVVAAFWEDSTATAAPLDMALAASGAAYDINTAGRIVGETFATAGGPAQAVTWDTELVAATTLAVPVGTTASSAYAVSNATAAEIVGELTDATGTHAVVWKPAVAPATGFTATMLPAPAAPTALSGNSVALSINDAGTIAGEITDEVNAVHAVRWIKSGTTYTVQDLGAGTAQDLNNGGRAVGQGAVTGSGAAWRATAPLTPFPIGAALAADVSLGLSINNVSRVVGVKNDQAFFARP